MTAPLLTPAKIVIEKTASTFSVQLGSEPNEWPVEIVKEAYKQLPFLQPHEVDLELTHMDEARGYAVGRLTVFPAHMSKVAAHDAKKLITVPVIIREKALSPLDVFTHDEIMHPMSEEKVASLLFRHETFGQPVKPGEMTGAGLGNQLSPPTQGRYSTGSSLLKSASATFRQDDVDAFRQTLRDDHALRLHVGALPALREAAGVVMGAKEKTAADLRGARKAHTKPTVVQFRAHGSDYLVKSANHRCFEVSEQVVDRFEAARHLPAGGLELLDKEGVLTFAMEPVLTEGEQVKTAQVAQRFGVYRTFKGSDPIEGVVFPVVTSLEGKLTSSQIFAGSGEHAMQEKVAGEFVRDTLALGETPRGVGVFFLQRGEVAMATEPVRIDHEVTVGRGSERMTKLSGARLRDNSPIEVEFVGGLQKVAMVGNVVVLPGDFQFMKLRGKQVGLPSTPDDVHAFSHQKLASQESVSIISDGHSFALRGANSQRVFGDTIMDRADAEFALGALGVPGKFARELVKTAATRGEARASRTRLVVSEQDSRMGALRKVASAVLAVKPERVRADLLKEVVVMSMGKTAAVIDKETADAILSLNFVTPENVQVYVDALPQLEKVSTKLAEILTASRLGMDDVREQAAKNAMVQLSRVVDGLKDLQAKIQ